MSDRRQFMAGCLAIPAAAAFQACKPERDQLWYDWSSSNGPRTNDPRFQHYGRLPMLRVFHDGKELAPDTPLVRCTAGPNGSLEVLASGPDGQYLLNDRRDEALRFVVRGHVRVEPPANDVS